MRQLIVPAGAAASLLYWTAVARGEVEPRVQPLNARGDGVYGRFDGDIDAALGLGARLSPEGPAPAARASLHYFSMAGVYASYADEFDDSDDEDAQRNLTSIGIDIKPMFLPRWTLGMQQGPRWLDLTVDSISLGIGAYFAASDDSRFGARRGLEASLGVGFPLLARAAGPWLDLRGGLLIPDGQSEQPAASLGILLSWHALWASPLSRHAP